MAQYKVYDPEEKIPCPYNKCEMIRAKRMPYHLIKCRRNHPCTEYTSCPLNATHIVPNPELRYHIDNCPDKARVEQNLAYEEYKKDGGTLFQGCTELPKYGKINLTSEEDWEKEIPLFPRIGVDPNLLAKMDGIQIHGLTASEKKHMKAQYDLPPEKRRYFENPDKPVEIVEKTKETELELRIPYKASKTYVPKPKSTKRQPQTVFAYSLSSTGVGRGQAAALSKEQETPEEAVGVARSVGRGTIRVGRGMADVDMGGDYSSLSLVGRGRIGRENQPNMSLAGEIFGVGTGRGVSIINADMQEPLGQFQPNLAQSILG
ncbi:uncharacterized protein LOC125683192 isoform X2 [Ostrea edulis]|uniref:uncharacterized protein LOC125683192 isoform X2 n=1 Tax=Ostrea edulis TaxID=37623 RepID=UPI0020961839|nr:uncharacterized protein LOC125683192 isoform X2 [Ostrea edulis]